MTEGIFIDQQKHVENIWGSAMTTGGIDKLVEESPWAGR